MQSTFSRGVACAVLACSAPAALAQQAQLPPVTVTGNPLGATDMVVPASQYSGTALLLRSHSTLGETLSATPGVASTYFGPNASRPVIRGLDGDRIRVLGNGGASLDASSLSYDHAVAADPIAIERVEVLRGPAALLHGGSAVGGVVNLIDNRIPREPFAGVRGRVDAAHATAASERSGAALVEAGNRRAAFHADVSARRARDVRVPIDLPCATAGVTQTARRMCNSAAHVRSGAVGGSLFFDHGYVGGSVTEYRNDYGTVAEDEVTIGMRSVRVSLEGEWRILGGPVKSVKVQAGRTSYRHTEFDAGAPGTLFSNQGTEVRVEARHADLGPLQGVVGLQAERSRFAADGDEAFAPYSRTRQQALFVFEELGTSWGKLTAGARVESVRVESLGNPGVARFATGVRSFRPASVAAGGLWRAAPAWQFTANVSSTRRAPKDYELFADGPHVATGAYEVGNPALEAERSRHADLGVQWKSGATFAKVSAWTTRFSNYVSLEATGFDRDVDGELLPEFAYRAVPARFRGAEAEGTLRLRASGGTLDLEWRADVVRARNAATGEPMPRIAPWRAGATLVWAAGPWGARVGFDHFGRQSRVLATDAPTPGYTLWTAAVTHRVKLPKADVLLYARLDNASDRLAYSATSILTQTAPGKSPLPGRGMKVGLRAEF